MNTNKQIRPFQIISPQHHPPVLLYPNTNWYKGGIKLFSPKTHFGIKVGIKVWANWYKGWYKQLLLLLTTLLISFSTYTNTILFIIFLSGKDLVKGVRYA